jgi:hypothetical protein
MGILRTSIGIALLLLLCSCSKSAVTRTTISTDGKWKAEIVAVSKPPLGLFEAELLVKHEGRERIRKTLFSGRDAVQDIENEVRSLNIHGSNVIVVTRGTYGAREITLPLQ